MKKIEAIIRKSRFEDVKKALLAADIEWFSYYNVRGEGKMRQARIYRGVMYDTSSIERVLLPRFTTRSLPSPMKMLLPPASAWPSLTRCSPVSAPVQPFGRPSSWPSARRTQARPS